jgi:hypothetical protein
VPRVEDLHLVALEEDEGRALTLDEHAAADPGAMVRARPPGPTTVHEQAALDPLRDAGRHGEPAGHGARVAVDALGPLGRQVGGRQRRGGGDHRAPARGAVVERQRLDGVQHLEGPGLGAAVAGRHPGPQQPGADEGGGDVVGEPAQRLGLRGPGRRLPPRRLDQLDQLDHERPPPVRRLTVTAPDPVEPVEAPERDEAPRRRRVGDLPIVVSPGLTPARPS